MLLPKMLLAAIAPLSLMLITAFQAKADLIVFNYTGNNFTSISGNTALTTSNYLTATLTYSVADGTGFVAGYQTGLIHWTISDQLNTLSDLTFQGASWDSLAIDATGQVTDWIFERDSICPTPCLSMRTGNNVGFVDDISGNFQGGSAINWNNPGTWTTTYIPSTPGSSTSTPEPGTFASAGVCSIAALVLYSRKRRAASVVSSK